MAYKKQNFIDGQVLTAEHLNTMETELAREKSWDELADKPFGEATVEIMQETELTGTENNGAYVSQLDASLFSGTEERLVVVFDGTTYDCAADTSQGFPIYGNLSMNGMGDDTGEPFIILVMVTNGLVILAMAESGAHTVSISSVGIKQIDKMYLPTGAAVLYFDSSSYLYSTSDTSDTSKRLTRTELMDLVNSGMQIYIYYNGAYFSTIYITDASDFCIVNVLPSTTATFEYHKYYTAEYTAS